MELAEKKFNILYVDDEETNLRIFKISFRKDYNVFTAVNGSEALQVMEEQDIDLIITDQQMPQMSGIDLLKKIIPIYPKTLRMIMTGFTDTNALIEAVNEIGINKYIKKPWSRDVLKETLDEELQQYLTEKGITGATDKEDHHIEIKETIDFVQKSFLKDEVAIQKTFKDSFLINSSLKSTSEVYWTGKMANSKVFCKVALSNNNNFAGILLNGLYATICNTILSWDNDTVNAKLLWEDIKNNIQWQNYLDFTSKMLPNGIDVTCVVKSEEEISIRSNQAFIHYVDQNDEIVSLRNDINIESSDIKDLFVYSSNLNGFQSNDFLKQPNGSPFKDLKDAIGNDLNSWLSTNEQKEGSTFFAFRF